MFNWTISLAQGLNLALSMLFMLVLVAITRALFATRTEHGLAQELAQKDNFALGISFGSHVLSIIILFAHVLLPTIDRAQSFLVHWPAILAQLPYFAAATVFLFMGQWLHRHWILSRFNEMEAIKKQNITAALIDSAVLIANAVAIAGLFSWAKPDTVHSVVILLCCYLSLQLLFLLDSKIQEWLFARTNQGANLQSFFNLENVSTGIRYSGRTLALGVSILLATTLHPYVPEVLVDNVISILLYGFMSWLTLVLLTRLVLRLFLFKVDRQVEIDQQDNIGIASIELTSYLGVAGFLLLFFQ